MAERDGFKDFVLDQLEGLPGLAARPMFGGHGLYGGASFFGIIYGGRLYFRTDSQSATKYVEAGSEPFRPRAAQALARYYEVPADVLEDRDRLTDWAREAAAARKPQRTPKRRNP